MKNQTDLSCSYDESYVIVPAVHSDELVTNSANQISHLLDSLTTAFQTLSTQERIELEKKFASLAMENTLQNTDSRINSVYVAIGEQMVTSSSMSSAYSDCSSGNRVNRLYVAIAKLMQKIDPNDRAQFINSISQDNMSRNNSSNSLSTLSDLDDIANIDTISNTQFSAQTVISRIAKPHALVENTETDDVTHNLMDEIILMLTRYSPDYSHIASLGVVALALLASVGIAMLVMMPVPVMDNAPIPTNIEPSPVPPYQQPQAPRGHGIFAHVRDFGPRDMMEREVRMQQASFDLRQRQQSMQRDIDGLNARNMDWVRRQI